MYTILAANFVNNQRLKSVGAYRALKLKYHQCLQSCLFFYHLYQPLNWMRLAAACISRNRKCTDAYESKIISFMTRWKKAHEETVLVPCHEYLGLLELSHKHYCFILHSESTCEIHGGTLCWALSLCVTHSGQNLLLVNI